MKQHTNRILMFLIVGIFALSTLLGTSETIEANDSHNDGYTVTGLLTVLEQLDADGEISNGAALRALRTHLIAVEHFEQQGDHDKVVQHLTSLSTLLTHQFTNQLISENAFHTLSDYSDSIIAQLTAPEMLAIVEGGQALAIIVIPDDADEQIIKAGQVLVEYVEKSTGATLPIITASHLEEHEEEYKGQVKVVVGTAQTAADDHIQEALANMVHDGFIIFPTDQYIHIAGPTVWGTLNGVHEFLERYAGVRWLMPGPEGEDVPQNENMYIPIQEVKEEPVFAYREISPAFGSPDTPGINQPLNEWAQRNKLQGGYNRPVQFIHNLYTLFPPAKYGESHPELYPGGNPPANNYSWQPCFTAEGSIDVAVAEVKQFFAENPDVNSISLAINDSTNFCEGNAGHPDYSGKINSVGLVDVSDVYYAWVNEVVEQVLEAYPDKWFGVLAYFNVMDPPSFPLHDRVVPFLTKDRHTWMDEEVQAAGHQQMEDWNEAASQVAWYDYMYGTLYVLPRVYPHQMAENFTYAEESHVYGHYIEMYHNLGDGPKAWLAAQLMWDPTQDVDALLQEWYERVVGAEAAPDLAALYEIWEDFWTEDITSSPWFESWKETTWLRFEEHTYTNLVTKADIEESMRLVHSVVEKAGTDAQKARALKIQKMFQYYEATVRSYPQVIETIDNESAALSLLNEIAANLNSRAHFVQERNKFRADFFGSDPILRFVSNRWHEWSQYNGTEFWGLANYISNFERDGGPVTSAVYELAQEDKTTEFGAFVNLLQGVVDGSLSTYTSNGSLEAGNEAVDLWTFWNPLHTATIERVEGIAHTGNASVSFQNADRAGIYQIFDVVPGLTAAEAHYYTPPGTKDGEVRLVISLLDGNGRTLSEYISATIPLADTAGEWATIEMLEHIPIFRNNSEVKQVLLNTQVLNARNEHVYLDDIALYILEGEGENIDNGSYTRNSSFEYGDSQAALWNFWKQTAPGSISRVDGFSRTGEASVKIDGINRGGPFQIFSYEGGPLSAQLYYKTEEDAATEGTIELILRGRDDQGRNLVTFTTGASTIQNTSGEWVPLSLDAIIPAEVNGLKVVEVQALLVVTDADDATFYIDDFEVRPGIYTINSSFERGNGNAEMWNFWKQTTPGTIQRVEGISRTGEASVRIAGINRGGPFQLFKFDGGPLSAQLHYRTEPGLQTEGTIELSVRARDDRGRVLASFTAGVNTIQDTSGEWVPVSLDAIIPEEVNGLKVVEVQALLVVTDADDATFYLDDFEVRSIVGEAE